MRFLSIIRYTILLVEEVQSVNLVQYIVWLLIIKEFFFFFLTKKNLLVMSPKCMIETHCFDLCECILNLTTLWSQAISSLCYYLTFFFNKWIYRGYLSKKKKKVNIYRNHLFEKTAIPRHPKNEMGLRPDGQPLSNVLSEILRYPLLEKFPC